MTVDCGDVRARLLAGDPPDAGMLAHAEGCAPCKELLAADRELARRLGGPEAGGPDLVAAVMARVREDRGRAGPMSRLTTPVRTAIVLAAGVAVVLLLGKAQLPDPHRQGELGLLAGMGLAAVALPTRPMYRPNPGRWWLWAGVALLAPAVLGAVLGHGDPAPALATVRCLVTGLGGAAVMLAALRLTERRWAPSTGWWVSAAAAAGVIAAVGLDLGCPGTDRVHLALGHGLAGVVAALVAALGTRR